MNDSPLFRARFYEELDALDQFFEQGARAGDLSFGTDDPDMRRIVEAMAFFSARTRSAAASSMRDAVIRMAGGLLDDLFAPLPALAMVEANAWNLVDGPVELAEGTRLRIETNEGQPSIFSTLSPLSLRPIRLEKAELQRRDPGATLVLTLRCRVPQKGELCLPLFLRRNGEYRAAAELHQALLQHFVSASVSKDAGVSETCSVSFVPPAPETPWDRGEEGSPLRRIRSFFHAPERDLFVRVVVPEGETAVSTLELRIELDGSFPETLSVARETFCLYAAAAENAWNDLAEPVIVDGTGEAVKLRLAQSVLSAVEPVTVRGVYRAVQKTLTPLPPRSLATNGAFYDVFFPDDGRVLVHVADDAALVTPWLAQVDAVWSQPALWQNARGPLSVKPQRKKLEGVSFRVVGNVRAPAPSPLTLSPEKGLDVLALKQKPTLDHRDLRALLELFGADSQSPFSRFPARIVGAKVRQVADPLGSRGARKRVYQVQMVRPPADEEALSPLFHRQMAALLDAWSPEAADLETTLPQAGQSGASP